MKSSVPQIAYFSDFWNLNMLELSQIFENWKLYILRGILYKP